MKLKAIIIFLIILTPASAAIMHNDTCVDYFDHEWIMNFYQQYNQDFAQDFSYAKKAFDRAMGNPKSIAFSLDEKPECYADQNISITYSAQKIISLKYADNMPVLNALCSTIYDLVKDALNDAAGCDGSHRLMLAIFSQTQPSSVGSHLVVCCLNRYLPNTTDEGAEKWSVGELEIEIMQALISRL